MIVVKVWKTLTVLIALAIAIGAERAGVVDIVRVALGFGNTLGLILFGTFLYVAYITAAKGRRRAFMFLWTGRLMLVAGAVVFAANLGPAMFIGVQESVWEIASLAASVLLLAVIWAGLVLYWKELASGGDVQQPKEGDERD